jgi:hypothetical protein
MKCLALCLAFFLSTPLFAERHLVWQHNGKGIDGLETKVTAYELSISNVGRTPENQTPVKLLGVDPSGVCKVGDAVAWLCSSTITDVFSGVPSGTYDVFVRARGGRLSDGTAADLSSEWTGPLTVIVDVQPGPDPDPEPVIEIPPQSPTGLTVIDDATPADLIDGTWLQTGSSNSTAPTDGVFFTQLDQIVTENESTDIHAMFTPKESILVETFEGEMLINNASGSLGVCLRSKWPAENEYVRVRNTPSVRSFHFWNRGPLDNGNHASTGIVPDVNVWYSFKVTVVGTEATATVWKSGTDAPVKAQASLTLPLTPTGTAVGFWSMGKGLKAWRGLKVNGKPIPIVLP